MRRIQIATMAAAAMLAGAWTASAALIITHYGNNYSGPGGITTALAGAAEYGNVRYRNLNNGGGGTGGEIYIGTGNLGSATVRSEIGFNWNNGKTPTLFEYDPSTGIEKATASLTSGDVSTSWGSGNILPQPYTTAQKVYWDANHGAPLTELSGRPVNYILLKLKETDPSTPFSFKITNLQGDLTLGTLSSVNGTEQFWLITDPTLLAGGFKLYGDLTLTGTGNGNEWDKVSMSFGNSVNVPVPEPSTYVAGALLLLPFGISTIRRLRKSNKA